MKNYNNGYTKIKGSVIFIFIVSICLAFGGCQATPANSSVSSDGAASATSDNGQSEDVSLVESAISSETQSKEESKEPASSKPISSKAISSKPTSSKTTSSKPAQPKATSSKPVSSKSDSSTAQSSTKPESEDIKVVITYDDGYDGQEIAKQVLLLVNQERSENQLEPLENNDILCKSADIRSREMAKAGSLTHVRPDGRKWGTSFDEAGFGNDYETGYENIAFGDDLVAAYNGEVDNYDVAKILFNSWKQSPSHYAAIINPKSNQTGIGVARIGNSIYVTEHFAEVNKPA